MNRTRAAESAFLSSSRLESHPPHQQGGNRRDRREHVPHRADLAGHRMLPADGRGKPILGTGDKQERGRQHDDRNEQRGVSHRQKRKAEIEQRAGGAEQQDEPAVSHAERIPHVADEPEYEGQIKRDRRDETEMRDLMRLQMQPVLEEEADRDIDQAARRAAEGQKDDQDTEVEKDAPANRWRQSFRSPFDRDGFGGTVHPHCPRSVLGWKSARHRTGPEPALTGAELPLFAIRFLFTR